MSYDLFFVARKPVHRSTVFDWLAAQPYAHVFEDRVGFENEATGVYFGFDFTEGEALPAFNLNYVRPHVFALEAEPVLSAFVAEFSLDVDDPQSNGMGQGPYSAEGFHRGWAEGNRFSYRAIFGEQDAPRPWTLPRASNHLAWTWNFEREAVQSLFEDDPELPPAYVPSVFLVENAANEVFTLSTWTGDMPLCLPRGVDLVSVSSPRGSLLVRLSDVLAHCPPVKEWSAAHQDSNGRVIGTPSVIIDTPSEDVLEAILERGQQTKLTRVPVDKVLDRETLEEALSAT